MPQASPSFSWLIPTTMRCMRTRAPTCRSTSCGPFVVDPRVMPRAFGPFFLVFVPVACFGIGLISTSFWSCILKTPIGVEPQRQDCALRRLLAQGLVNDEELRASLGGGSVSRVTKVRYLIAHSRCELERAPVLQLGVEFAFQ